MEATGWWVLNAGRESSEGDGRKGLWLAGGHSGERAHVATCLQLKVEDGSRDGAFYRVMQRVAHLDSVNLAQGRPGEGLMTVPEVS